MYALGLSLPGWSISTYAVRYVRDIRTIAHQCLTPRYASPKMNRVCSIWVIDDNTFTAHSRVKVKLWSKYLPVPALIHNNNNHNGNNIDNFKYFIANYTGVHEQIDLKPSQPAYLITTCFNYFRRIVRNPSTSPFYIYPTSMRSHSAIQH